MDDTERQATGAAMRKANKGPANAVIREATAEEVDAAFNDPSGDRGPALPGANKVNGPGGKGSVAGIRTGTKEAGGGLDVKAAENLRIRQARKAAAAAAAKGGTPQPPAPAPVQQAPVAPLEDWETPPVPKPLIEIARELAPATRRAADDFKPGDRLAVATMDALGLLARLPDGFELFVSGGGLGPEGVEIVMGLGFLIGKGYAAYRGDSHYRLTQDGRAAYRRGESEHA